MKANNSILIGGAIGLLYFLLRPPSSKLSPKSTISSIGLKDQTMQDVITGILTGEGYSQRMASNWHKVGKMETAGWSSPNFIQRNNAFGMKQPQKRETLSVAPKSDRWARFATVDDSVRDLHLYMREFNYPYDFKTLEDQISFMKQKGYFEEPYGQYLGLVIAWKDRQLA
jgi:hypothetical protein